MSAGKGMTPIKGVNWNKFRDGMDNINWTKKQDDSTMEKNISIHNDKEIKGFFCEYRWLSNFWPCQIQYDGDIYPSTEHAYQAAKLPKDKRSPFFNCTAAESKALGKKCALPHGWNDVKESIMSLILFNKFNNNEDLKKKLLATGDKYLEETNWWGDCEWGVCKGVGKNKLGKMLMGIRGQLK